MNGHEDLDCLIVGAGPAGLVAATYLTRFHRRIAVVDAGSSRARWIPSSHNCPGFPFGVSGEDLLAKLRTQAEGFGAPITRGRIVRIERRADGFVALDDHSRAYRSSCVLLATGMPSPRDPEGAWEAYRRSRFDYPPYEVGRENYLRDEQESVLE